LSGNDTNPVPNNSAADSKQRFLIGSQRNPTAYRPKRRDWVPVEEATPPPPAAASEQPAATEQRTAAVQPATAVPVAPVAAVEKPVSPPVDLPIAEKPVENVAQIVAPQIMPPEVVRQSEVPPATPSPIDDLAMPEPRRSFSTKLDDEVAQSLDDAAFERMLQGDTLSSGETLEPDSIHTAKVLAVRRDNVFLELGGREQGIMSLRQFTEPPKPGNIVRVVVQRINADDGLYELSLPGASVKVEDWSQLSAGMLVEAQVTGHNTGGLECEVNHIRGFIPISQVALYRVEDLAEFVGQHFTCLVTEANPDRRNLVLSRRAVLEREKQEAKQQFLNSLQPGQIFDGVVRKLLDFGAFVDIGGADGLLHVSQLAWHRVNHPSEVLTLGQQIKVKIEKIDPTTGKISLAYRDLLENPWAAAAAKYPPNSVARGTVTKLMEFGAFVELERGVEGLVHISELSHKRVWRASDVVKEGDQVEAVVLSVDPAAQRISLSMKAISPPEPPKKEESAESPSEAAPTSPPKHKAPSKPLQGGLGRVKGGQQFGINW
jgi:predicted RNA-binding protein with RPS1 domain